MELVHTPANGGVAPAPATEREPKRARLEDGGALTISPRFTAESGALRLVQAHPKLLEALRRGDEVRFVGRAATARSCSRRPTRPSRCSRPRART